MKMLGNALFFFCLPFVLFVGAGYAYAFPMKALAVVGIPLALFVAVVAYQVSVLEFEAGIQRRARDAERERQAQQQQRVAISADIHQAMSPNYDPARTVAAPGKVAIKRGNKPPAPPKPQGWADDATIRNSPFFRG